MSIDNELVFLTNDDGYTSKGLGILKVILANIFNNFWVFAPSLNQSAKSQSITINKRLLLKKIKNREFTLNGTPTDCVIIGLEKLKQQKKKPTILFSGINQGVNMGLDLLYSGTVAAAREGSLSGILSIALSIDVKNNIINWEGLKKFAPDIIKNIVKSKISDNYFFNINFPSLSYNKIKGVKLVKPGRRKPGSVIKKFEGKFFKIPSERKKLKNSIPGEDEYELRRDFITVSIHDYNNLIISEEQFLRLKKKIGINFE